MFVATGDSIGISNGDKVAATFHNGRIYYIIPKITSQVDISALRSILPDGTDDRLEVNQISTYLDVPATSTVPWNLGSDGTYFYITTLRTNKYHRLDPADNFALEEHSFTWDDSGGIIQGMGYDSVNNRLILVRGGGSIYAYDPATHNTSYLFATGITSFKCLAVINEKIYVGNSSTNAVYVYDFDGNRLHNEEFALPHTHVNSMAVQDNKRLWTGTTSDEKFWSYVDVPGFTLRESSGIVYNNKGLGYYPHDDFHYILYSGGSIGRVTYHKLNGSNVNGSIVNPFGNNVVVKGITYSDDPVVANRRVYALCGDRTVCVLPGTHSSTNEAIADEQFELGHEDHVYEGLQFIQIINNDSLITLHAPNRVSIHHLTGGQAGITSHLFNLAGITDGKAITTFTIGLIVYFLVLDETARHVYCYAWTTPTATRHREYEFDVIDEGSTLTPEGMVYHNGNVYISFGSKIQKYSIIANNIIDVKHSTVKRVTKEQSAMYSISNLVATLYALKYNISNSISSVKSFLYSLQNSVTTSKPFRYTINYFARYFGNENWDVTPLNPRGITHTGTGFSILDFNTVHVYGYTSAGVRDTSTDFDLTAANSRPFGIDHDGSQFWVVDASQNGTTSLFSYDEDGTPDRQIALPGTMIGRSVVALNGKLYVGDNLAVKKIVIVDIATGALESSFTLSHSVNPRPLGLTSHNDRLYIADNDDNVYCYNTDGTRHTAHDFAMAAENTAPEGITFYDNKMYILDGTDRRVYTYLVYPDFLLQAINFAYSILGRVSESKNLEYSVTNSIANARSFLYSLKNSVTQSRSFSYTILGIVSRLHSLQYSLEERVIRTHLIRYTIGDSIVRLFDIRYSIIQRVTKAHPVRYSTIERIVRALQTKYSIIQRITRPHPMSYSVIQRIVQAVRIRYGINGFVRTFALIEYSVRNSIDRAYPFKYSIKLPVSKPVNISYQIIERILKSYPVRYNIGNMIAQIFELQYSVSILRQATHNVRYNLSNSVGLAISLVYSISNSVIRPRPITYNIHNSFKNAITVSWRILRAAVNSYRIKYEITAPIPFDYSGIESFTLPYATHTTRVNFLRFTGVSDDIL